MTDIKVGARVELLYMPDVKGYVSGVHKGHLFALDDPMVYVHVGDGQQIVCNASDLKVLGHFDDPIQTTN